MDVGKILHDARQILSWMWNIGYVAGDSGALERSSQVWHGMEKDLGELHDRLDQAVRQHLTGGRGGNWNDPAGDAFQKYWTGAAQTIADLSGKYGQMGGALHEISGEVEHFNGATRSVVLELGAWIAVAAALEAVPVVDLVADAAAVVRGAVLVERFWNLIRLIVLFLNGVRKAFAINLLVFYFSRLIERGILNPVHDPTKGWSKYDGQQMLWGSLIASGFSSAITLPRTIATVRALGTVGAGLTDGTLSAGAGVTDSALAATLKQAGFKGAGVVPTTAEVTSKLGSLWVKTPAMLNGVQRIAVPKLLDGKIWFSRLPLARALPLAGRGADVFDMTVERLLTSLGTANAFNTFNRGVIEGRTGGFGQVLATGTVSTSGPAALIALGNAISFLTLGRTVSIALTLPTLVTLNTTLEVVFPAVRDARGLHFDTFVLDLPRGQTLEQLPDGRIVVGAPPTYTVARNDTLWDIAMKQYGDPRVFDWIVRRNHIRNPDLIHVGQEIVLPPIPLLALGH